MTSRHVRPLLSAYLDGEVTPDERAEVERHLAACPECTRVLAEYRTLGRNIRELSRPVPPTALHSAVWAAIERRERQNTWGPGLAGLLRYGAIAAVAVLVVAVVLNVVQQPGPQAAAKLIAPRADQTGVPRYVPVLIGFGKPVDTAQAPGSVVAVAPDDPANTAVAGWVGSQELSLNPAAGWEANTTYTITVLTKLRFADNTQLLTPVTWHFTTGVELYTPTATGTPGPLPSETVPASATVLPTETRPVPTFAPPVPTRAPLPPTAVAVNTVAPPPIMPPTITREPTHVVARPTLVPPATVTDVPPAPTSPPTAPPTATAPRPATATPVPASPTEPRPSATPVGPTHTPTPRPSATPAGPTATPTPLPALGTAPPASGTPTPEATSTPGLTPTAPAEVSGTPTPDASPTAVGCSIQPKGSFGQIYRTQFAVRSVLGCASTSEHVIQPAVVESFEHGLMFWDGAAKRVYVFDDPAQSWAVYPDTWNDGDPNGDATPPAGLYAPVRGFGKVWRDNPAVRTALGWALAPEYPVQAFMQDFANGQMLRYESSTVRVLYGSHIWDSFVVP